METYLSADVLQTAACVAPITATVLLTADAVLQTANAVLPTAAVRGGPNRCCTAHISCCGAPIFFCATANICFRAPNSC